MFLKNSHRRFTSLIYRLAAVTIAVVLLISAGCQASVPAVGSSPSSDTSFDPSFAGSSTGSSSGTSVGTTSTTVAPLLDPLSLHSACVLVYDETNDMVLLSSHAQDRAYPASLTKLLTAAVALKYCAADDPVKVGSEITLIPRDASRAFLQQGWTIPMSGMLAALLLPSGSDAAYSIAVHVARQESGQNLSVSQCLARFAELMNETASEIGATHSHFVTVDGIHDDDHYSTAEDLLLISRYAMSFTVIADLVGSARKSVYTVSGKGVTFNNTNYLLKADSPYYFEYATGLKTGFTDPAGYCLSASAEKDGTRLIAILLGAPNPNDRFEDAKRLFETAFAAQGG